MKVLRRNICKKQRNVFVWEIFKNIMILFLLWELFKWNLFVALQMNMARQTGFIYVNLKLNCHQN
jgi:hypothetical protein